MQRGVCCLNRMPVTTCVSITSSKILSRNASKKDRMRDRKLPLSIHDAVMTLQSLHDVGGPEEIRSIYASSFELLRPGGKLLSVDFMVPEGEVTEEQPGRLPVSWHLASLSKLGFVAAHPSIEGGKLSCCVGRKPESASDEMRSPNL